jgi:hypothetical protein
MVSIARESTRTGTEHLAAPFDDLTRPAGRARGGRLEESGAWGASRTGVGPIHS